ncbi:MAG: hypothetical protein IJF62_02570 [Firmicutes bacterium]|nr:hypothetical protein [Bacillota bacterium]MBQ3112153.1 hypothetical protein [Bacillota bacterium]MBQ6842119.1 hypothetical protein [Bacillota bacterium]MBR6824536.1 hypothetical protein [Bacillota bacterium]MBR7113611.1 hypothetical protein [Bacillota bacterium]
MDTIINVVTSVPVLFIIFFLLAYLFIAFMGNYAAVGAESERKVEAYASGQRNARHRAAPDYSTFFPFAMFFTLMHVLTLVVTTAPSSALALPLLYICVGLLALLIIFRR